MMNATQTATEIATTILEQLGGFGRLLWMWQEKRHVPAGTVVFQVSWREFTKAAIKRREADPDHDHDPDSDELEHYREFPNVIAARRFAKSTARKRSCYGYAEVEELHAQRDECIPYPVVGEWVRVGEPEVIE